MEPYESIYVGNFIFTLGYLTKEKGIKLSSQGASLMAQNVGDEVIADLISSWGGKNFVIEFKRNEKSVKTEFDKEHKRELIRRLIIDDDPEKNEGVSLASRGHFLGYGDFEPNNGITGLSFSQYHKIQNSDIQTDDRANLSDFIFKIVMSKEFGLTDNELGKYIDFLASAFSSGTGGSNGGAANKVKKVREMSSLVINYNEKRSEINFVSCNLSMAKKLTLEPKVELKPELKKTLNRSSDFTNGM